MLMTKVRERLEDARESCVGAVKLNGRLMEILEYGTVALAFFALQRLSFNGGIAEEHSLGLIGYGMDSAGKYVRLEKAIAASVVRSVYQAERQTRPNIPCGLKKMISRKPALVTTLSLVAP